MKKLRAEINVLLQMVPTRRKPSLRRCAEPDFLFVTDLPMIAEEKDIYVFCSNAEAAGWSTRHEGDYLYLDRIPMPPEGKKRILSGERACCAFLMERHAGTSQPDVEIRAWLKAEETGRQESLCAAWHREWAERIRKGDSLPGPPLLNWLTLEKEDKE